MTKYLSIADNVSMNSSTGMRRSSSRSSVKSMVSCKTAFDITFLCFSSWHGFSAWCIPAKFTFLQPSLKSYQCVVKTQKITHLLQCTYFNTVDSMFRLYCLFSFDYRFYVGYLLCFVLFTFLFCVQLFSLFIYYSQVL